MSKGAFLSVLLPTLNSDIAATSMALESLRDQDFANFECIVIDDSTDTLVADFLKEFCASDHRFVYHRGPSKGLGSALNYGVSLATGSLVARADDTDVSRRDRFSLQVKFLAQNPGVGVVGSDMQILKPGSSKTRRYPSTHIGIGLSFFYRCPIAHPTVIMRKEILDEFGSYNPKFRFCEDLELWLRLYRKGVVFSNIKQPLVAYNNDILARGKKHYYYNTLARLINSGSPLILVSTLVSLLHFIVPLGIRKFLFEKLN